MGAVFQEEIRGIYRLKVPFDRIYTSVFLVVSGARAALVDCATTEKDVEEYVIPALGRLGYEIADLDVIVLTHRHGDHAGGLKRILSSAPRIEVVEDLRTLFDGIETYPMAGHTKGCIGILDTRSHTLISGDGLQGAGVDKYRCSLQDPTEYRKTLQRIREDERIQNILFSHAYEPWNRDSAFGRENVRACIKQCEQYIKEKI